ncbi:MAG: YceI family protein [Cryomorphaceae bacterium]|nr:YceI family protein [Cryomorphaceae bacterium]
MKAFLLIAIATLSSISIYAQDEAYVRFEIRNAGVNVQGKFTEYDTNININPKDLSNATFRGVISVESIDTGIKKRDKDLKKKNYFDIEKHPNISFELTSIKANGEGAGYVISGDLTIKDVTKSVSFTAIKVRVSDDLYIKGELTLNRRDFNVGGSSLMLSDELKASFRLPIR